DWSLLAPCLGRRDEGPGSRRLSTRCLRRSLSEVGRLADEWGVLNARKGLWETAYDKCREFRHGERSAAALHRYQPRSRSGPVCRSVRWLAQDLLTDKQISLSLRYNPAL